MSTIIKGDAQIVYIHDGTAYRPVACLTSNSLSSTLSILEGNNKCNPGVTTKEAGTFAYSISMDGEYIDTTSVSGDGAKASHDYLLQKQMDAQTINWRISTGLADQSDYYGSALISDLGNDSPSGEKATFSATFDGNGTILLEDPLV